MTEPAAPVTEQEILTFVRGSIASVWELELLLLLYGSRERRWTARELERELRASTMVIGSALRRFVGTHVVAEPVPGEFQYQPRTTRISELVRGLEETYRTNPVSVIKVVLGAPDAQLKVFSDAFRFKG